MQRGVMSKEELRSREERDGRADRVSDAAELLSVEGEWRVAKVDGEATGWVSWMRAATAAPAAAAI